MKKTFSALTLAAVMAAPSAQAVDFQVNDDTLFSVYGDFQMMYLSEEREDSAGNVDSETDLVDNGSTLGFEGEHAFGNGLTGYFRAEYEFEATEGARDDGESGIDSTDEVFIGLEGSAGAVQIGTWDGIYQDSISDVLDAFERADPGEFDDSETGDQIAYFSPNFGGFSFELQAGQEEGSSTASGDSEQTFIAVAKYSTDMWAVHVGYDDRGLYTGGAATEEGDADGVLGVAGTVSLGQFSLGAKVEDVGESNDNADDDFNTYGLIGEFDYGPGSIKATVQEIRYSEETATRQDRTVFIANANYSVADNLYFYVEGGQFDQEDDLGDYAGVGTVYSF